MPVMRVILAPIGEGRVLQNGMWIKPGEIAIPANTEGPGAGNEEIPIAHTLVYDAPFAATQKARGSGARPNHAGPIAGRW
jgi:hypothetical protein